MDTKELKALERQCIEDQPPFCTATCPLHLDARQFVGYIAEGQWETARRILDGMLPFADILARICDHPCQDKCRRGEAGDPVAIGALEIACVNAVLSRAPVVNPLMEKMETVVILGAGLSGMTAAWELRQKGYTVTLKTEYDRLGDCFYQVPETMLPRVIIENELRRIKQSGITVRLNEIITAKIVEKIVADYDAVFIDTDIFDAETLCPDIQENGVVTVDPLTLHTRFGKVFAGGKKTCSWVLKAARGRWASVSIDRYLMKVSLTAARKNQGPVKSRLFTDISSVRPLQHIPMAHSDKGYTSDEAEEEAKRCLQCHCLECVKACAYLSHYGKYPKTYVREIYNNSLIALGTRKANTLINSCSLCGLCEEVCPENLSMTEVCKSARKEMVLDDKMPPSAHEFALNDMVFANNSEAFLFRCEPGSDSARYLFYPGCQLGASSPKLAAFAYAWLRANLKGGVAIGLGCCGAPADWAGRIDLMDKVENDFQKYWQTMGTPTVIAACPTCCRMFAEHHPLVKVISLWEMINTLDLPAASLRKKNHQTFVLHDACTARNAPEIRQSVRQLLRRLGVGVVELSYSKNRTRCCGFGGLAQNANPVVAGKMAEIRAAESQHDMVTYCAMCRDNLRAVGKRTRYLLDLVFDTDSVNDPAEEPPPGLSLRRENRVRLKNRLLRDIWNEQPPDSDAYKNIILTIPPDVYRIMEDRRILADDIKQVIYYTEKTGQSFLNLRTGHLLAAYRPIHVTFWVEYSPEEKHYLIHNCYCHRMMIQQTEGPARSLQDMEMPADWSCSGCGAPLSAAKVSLEYLDNRFTPDLPACHACNQVFISEELSQGKMIEVEKMLEDK